MNLMHLERILFVAKIGNITEAAKKLYISQSALSQMINTVEEELGTLIFDRRVKPMRLTGAGEHYIAMARHVTNAHNAMLNELDSLKSGTRGVISCGISHRRSRMMLPLILRAFSAAYPRVSLRLITGASNEFESLLLRGELDMAFCSLPPNETKIKSLRLNEERHMLVAARDSSLAKRLDARRLAAGDMALPVPLAEAKDERFIAAALRSEARNVLNLMFEEAMIHPLISIEALNSEIAAEYVRTGLGVSVIAQSFPNSAPFDYQNDAVSLFHIESKYARRSMYLNYDKAVTVSPPHRRLIRLIFEHFGSRGTAFPQELL